VAELLGDVHDPEAQTALLHRIEDLLGADSERTTDAQSNAAGPGMNSIPARKCWPPRSMVAAGTRFRHLGSPVLSPHHAA
jgi:hypothetical protein